MVRKNALVTGGAGFVGSHLCEELLSKGYTVTCLDNLLAGSKKNLDSFHNNKKFRFVEGDVRNKTLIFDEVKKVDIIFHLAAIVGVSVVVNNPLENISVNLEGITNVCSAAVKTGVKKVVFTSSSEVYGKNSSIPLIEDVSDSIFGTTQVTRWAYGMAKALGEHIILASKEKGLKFAIVRYFNCYGPRGINKNYVNVIPNFIKASLKNEPITIHSKGLQTRCFCYVKDTVSGTILAAEKLENDIVNIGSNKEITILSLAKKIKKLTKSRSKFIFIPEQKIFNKKFEGSSRRVPSVEKAKKLLNFSPKINLEEGLRNTIEWTKKTI